LAAASWCIIICSFAEALLPLTDKMLRGKAEQIRSDVLPSLVTGVQALKGGAS